jgi:hypothetical protein
MNPVPRPRVRVRSYTLAFLVIASFLVLGHAPLLQLPFYWDEIGQFVPASLDLFRHGDLIPHSTAPNVHPPGVMLYLAAVWSIFGFSIITTRLAMLVVAALGALAALLLGIELSRGAPGAPAFPSLCLLCLSPLFFAQSMMALLDLPAMCLSLLALLFFLQNRFRASAFTCLALVLVKETGIVAPALFACWLIAEKRKSGVRDAAWFLMAPLALLAWIAALHRATSYWLGNQSFMTYNLWQPLNPVRFLLAAGQRLYYLFIGSGHFIGTLVLIWAWPRMPLFRNRPWRIASTFVVLHTMLVSLLGGAILERYLLPVLPILYVAFAASMQALRPPKRQIVLLALLACLITASFVNPRYPFPYENNLAFVSVVQLEQEAAAAVEAHGDTVTASVFPMTDAMKNPDFGFVRSARTMIQVPDFGSGEVETLKSRMPDAVIVFHRAWDPLHLLSYPAIESFLEKHYDFHPELSAEEIARELSMHVTERWTRRGLAMELLERGRQTIVPVSLRNNSQRP